MKTAFAVDQVSPVPGTIRRWLRPITHAGVPAGATRSDERELVTANVVIFAAALFTLPDAINYVVLDEPATHRAAISAFSAIAAYIAGFLLIRAGRRFAGIFLFSASVFTNLTALTIILGTRCGVQYYFMAVGLGSILVWPQMFHRMRLPQALAGMVMFGLLVHFIGPDPIADPVLSEKAVTSIYTRMTFGSYLISAALAFYAVVITEKAETALEAEHRKSESLLENILPAAIVERLKRSGEPIAERFDEVTILFADVVGFTPMSEQLSPDTVVSFLNRLFSELDRLAGKHGLEKIKTIGDAYMVAGGIPERRPDHAVAVAEMALDLQGLAASLPVPGGGRLSLRVGISSGPAVAGVIGLRKFAYDLWGDTVNTASRMESHGVPGRITVTERTRSLLADGFEFEDRGVVEVKGKGPMPLYFLVGRRTPAASGLPPVST